MRCSSLLISLLAGGGVASAAASDPARTSRISVRGQQFVDEYGRVRIFRGFNDVANSPSQGESTGQFDGTNYLPRILTKNNTRLAELVDDFGFNCFRVMASWSAVQPAPGEIDDSYLAALSNVTRLLADHGAFSLLDMHQDGLSANWGSYDGMPRWLANLTCGRVAARDHVARVRMVTALHDRAGLYPARLRASRAAPCAQATGGGA